MNRFGHLDTLPDVPFRFVAVDVETAGRTIDSICQIGLCGVGLDGRLYTFSVLVDPQGPFISFNTDLHGISAELVAGAPSFPQVWQDLAPVLNACPLVQHSTYDEKSITAACRRYGLRMVTSHWTDSVRIARRAWPELKGNGGHGLGNLKKLLDLEFQHHDAGEDARAAALVILHAERTLGKRLTHLRSSQQLSFDFGPDACQASARQEGQTSTGRSTA